MGAAVSVERSTRGSFEASYVASGLSQLHAFGFETREKQKKKSIETRPLSSAEIGRPI
jgi:hypothetical protein